MTLPRTELSHSGLWCGEATLESFGVTSRDGKMSVWQIRSQLKHNGGYECFGVCVIDYPTLTKFIAEHPEGDYILFTRGHAMSLRDGKLTDTDTDSGGRRRVVEAYRVEMMWS